MSKSNKSKVTVRAELPSLINGLTQHYAGQTLVLNGVSIKTEDLVAKLKSLLTAMDAADVARAAWLAKVDVARTQETAVNPLVGAAHTYVRLDFGPSSNTLADFGLTPRRVVSKRTTAAKAQSAAKSLATRDARHTMGPKQKAAIHGTVPAAPAAPVSSTATPAPAAVASNAVKGGSTPS